LLSIHEDVIQENLEEIAKMEELKQSIRPGSEKFANKDKQAKMRRWYLSVFLHSFIILYAICIILLQFV
jgi:hypothetical protein